MSKVCVYFVITVHLWKLHIYSYSKCTYITFLCKLTSMLDLRVNFGLFHRTLIVSGSLLRRLKTPAIAVLTVEADSPAERADLQVGDVIIEVRTPARTRH